MNKTIVLVDALNAVHRSAHSYVGLATKDKRPTGAIFGTLSLIFSLHKYVEEPYTVVVVWEGGAHTPGGPRVKSWRAHYIDKRYKGQREINPVTLEALSQVPALVEAFDILRMPQIYVPGLEADDLIGIGATLLRDKSTVDKVMIYSSDRDFYQLIDGKIIVLQPKGSGKAKKVRVKDVLAEYQVDPSVFDQYKALVGDTSDNYKGVPGVGPVAARQMIAEGIRPSYTDFADNPKLARVKWESKLKRYWAEANRCYVLAHIPRSVTYGMLPKELRAPAQKSLRLALGRTHQTYTQAEYNESVRNWTRFCADYELATFLAERRRFLAHLTVS